ncbi:MAG: hypothetical protein KDK36_07980, partial [Leptospiraceae bacterium]|nr:hypothetical protein [Leptospiraceae bacterium]
KIYDLELKSLENLEVLIQSELRLIDMLTEVSDNLVLTLMMNSIRPLQTKMIEYFIKGIGIKEFKSYILQRKKMISGILANNPDDQKVNIQRYKVLMEKYRDILKAKLAKSI